ncbi:hypothetical protein [Mycoplasmopsis lipofaciens]|uniref:hypothetical protein n=1 Tax=Mycoplasmopsis lipofaciens TaxID=114884 RepID=UPI000488CF7E|nr:hypothetical protein [Mycoplasmopsis lipofaciens]
MTKKQLIKYSKNYLKNNGLYKNYKKVFCFRQTKFSIEKIIQIFNFKINTDFLNLINNYLIDDKNKNMDDFVNKIISIFSKITSDDEKMLRNFWSYYWLAINKYYMLRLGSKQFSVYNPYKEEIIYEVDITKRNYFSSFLDEFKKRQNFNIKLRKIFKSCPFLLTTSYN